MGTGQSLSSGLVTGISAVAMAFSAVAAGYFYSLWVEFPESNDTVFGAALRALEPLVPVLVLVSVGLFVLAAVAMVFTVRGIRGW